MEQSKKRDHSLDFWKAHLSLFRTLLGRIPWYAALERRAVQESWVILRITSSKLKKDPLWQKKTWSWWTPNLL